MANPETYSAKRAFLRDGGAMAALIAGHDWTSSPLGPLDAWPAALKTMMSAILSSSSPMALFLGDEAIALYNDAYAALFRGGAAPLGAKVREIWPELAGLAEEAVKAAQRGERFALRDVEVRVSRQGVPERVRMNIDCSPVRDENGVYLGVLASAGEAAESTATDRNASVHFDRLRKMFDQAPGFVCLLGGPPDYVVEYVNEANKQLFGDRDAEGKRYLDAFGDVIAEGKPEVIFQAYATGRRYLGRGQPVFVPRPEGGREKRFIDVVVQPVNDEAGRVVGVYIEGFDVTFQVRAQQEADESARRLSAAVSVARLGTFEVVPGTSEAVLDERARQIFGFGPDERPALPELLGRFDPEDLKRLALQDAAALATGQTRREAEYRICLPDGAIRHVSVVGDLVAGPDGLPLWNIGLIEDVTERYRAEERQLLLVNELNHRVKNTLATVQSIASQTLRSANDLIEARASFEARLVALAAAHDLLTAQSWRGASMHDVVAAAIAPFEVEQRPQVSWNGPAVWLAAPRALALSLALHELATNAVKHGALAIPSGQVSVRWALSEGDVAFTWCEAGGPPVPAQPRPGFGMRLLQRSLARELGGAVALDLASAGVRCEISFAIESREPAAER